LRKMEPQSIEDRRRVGRRKEDFLKGRVVRKERRKVPTNIVIHLATLSVKGGERSQMKRGGGDRHSSPEVGEGRAKIVFETPHSR